MIDNEDLKDMVTRHKHARSSIQSGVIQESQALWWASYYRSDVQALMEELQTLDDALRDILDITGGWCRPMKDDAERLRVIQAIGYEALGIKRSNGVQGGQE